MLTFVLTDAGARTWKDASGKFEVEAELVSANREKVVLKKADGSTLTIALSKLSAADAKFVAQASDRGSHHPSSGERLAAGTKALGFLAKHRLPKPREKRPDDEIVRASVEGLAMFATGDTRLYRDQIDKRLTYIARHALPKNLQKDDVGMSTRALSYALMFSVEHALSLNAQQSRRLAHDIATELTGRQAETGGWSASGVTDVVNATADGTAIGLVAMGAVGKLGEVKGAAEAKLGAIKFLKKCTVTKAPGSGTVSVRPGGDVHEFSNGSRSMIGANAFSMNGEKGSLEFTGILAYLRKLGRNMVMPSNQKTVGRIEGETFLALLYHRESQNDSAKYWDRRLQAISGTQRADGSFPDPTEIFSGAANLIGAFDKNAAAEFEKQEAERQLPSVIQTTAFRALTLLIPQGELEIFADEKP